MAALIYRHFAGEGVHDLERAGTFLLEERPANVANKRLKQLLQQWDSTIHGYRLSGETASIQVSLHLVVLGEHLTQQAHAEFTASQSLLSSTTLLHDVAIQFRTVLHTIDPIIDGRWREDNRG
jgi:hypothetical protein